MIKLVGTEKQVHLATTPHPTRKRMLGGIPLNYLIETLNILQEEKRWGEYMRISPYRYKKSALKILKWCAEKNLITRREHFKSMFKNRKDPEVYYKITEQGRELLRMIR